ncbi:Peroxidase [Mycena venus]|uniref:Peroxidase n=1 Tax=Mycena venus TaxID=2733690 RepID=A0A8H7CTY9_9AGAR|nr:Peroxidase [Mycena venus]
MFIKHGLLPLVSLLCYTGARAYVWPGPYDLLEDEYTVSTVLGDFIEPCSAPVLPGIRLAAAEWLRTAYHDMATHNVSTGLGGLDASIGFETDRPQNIGSAMNDSLNFFVSLQSRTSSMSDIIALAAVLVVKSCGGPGIPYRPGRIDATEAGPATVPEPQQDLATHISMFASQGFNVTEMIGLVACGHTIGGVHQVDFPFTIENSITDSNPDGIVHFDDTFATFDNHIASQWISGQSVDPIAVGFNATTNSDARIFAADGNATMSGFASNPDHFQSQCGSLFERMVNTVPNSVHLADVLEPLPVKPHRLSLAVTDGSLVLAGQIRIFSTSAEAAAASPDDMPVTLRWTDRNGKTNATYAASLTADFPPTTSLWGSLYFFNAKIVLDAGLGISSFVIDYAFDPSSPLIHGDNGGGGFPLQDIAFFQSNQFCTNITTGDTSVTAMIRNDMGPIGDAYIEYTFGVSQPGTVVLRQVTVRTALTRVGNSSLPLYDEYTALLDLGGFPTITNIVTDLVAEIGQKTYTDVFTLSPGFC